MGRPYSIDLRERAVLAVEEGGMSRRRAAAQFGVGINTVITWVRRFRETGSVAPGKMGGRKPKAIRGEHHIWLLQRIDGKDFTIRGLVAEFAERGLKHAAGMRQLLRKCRICTDLISSRSSRLLKKPPDKPLRI
jgi:putative transposase